MKLNSEQVLGLVIAALATYNYSMEKAWALKPELERLGFADPDTVIGVDEGKVGVRLIEAGYDRGGITFIIAPRVIQLMTAIEAGELDSLPKHINSKAKSKFCDVLQKVKGFGPKSSGIAWELLKPAN